MRCDREMFTWGGMRFWQGVWCDAGIWKILHTSLYVTHIQHVKMWYFTDLWLHKKFWPENNNILYSLSFASPCFLILFYLHLHPSHSFLYPPLLISFSLSGFVFLPVLPALVYLINFPPCLPCVHTSAFSYWNLLEILSLWVWHCRSVLLLWLPIDIMIICYIPVHDCC